MEAGRACVRQRQERTDVRRRYPEGVLLYAAVRQQSEQRPAGGKAEKMRERINTFETVLNVDQFLVRLSRWWTEKSSSNPWKCFD